MAKITIRRSLPLLLLSAMIWSTDGLADTPQMALQMRAGQTAGKLADGTLLARGTLSFTAEHVGFRVYSTATMNGQPSRYTLTGRDNPTHKMDVRLAGGGWQPDTVSGQGIILRTSDYSAVFSVEVDGMQQLPVDSWPLQLQAVVLLP